MELLVGKATCALFVALGGGGDVASAAMLALAARRLGIKSHVASIIWERLPIDPIPGPVRFNEVVGSIRIGEHAMIVTKDSRALRGGRAIAFQAANVSKVLGEPVGVVDVASGCAGVKEGLKELSTYFGCDTILGVDVGGDVLATGFERELWSPLADFIGLAALKDLRDVQGVLAVHSPGSDGELSPEYILRRIALVAERGGYLGARGVTLEDIESLEKILEHVESEASRATLMAAKGAYGKVEIRSGSRTVYVTPLSLITFFLKPRIVAELNPLISELSSTRSIEEARRRLNKRGVYTELDLEEDAYKLMIEGRREVSGEALKKLKESWLAKRSRDVDVSQPGGSA
ncbi:MAG: DUF1152 domain-containing protein [Thermosphaera sp.]